MNFIQKYLKRNTRYGDIPSRGQPKRGKIYLGLIGTLLFVLLWAVGGTWVFKRPDLKQFSGFLPLPTLNALKMLVVDSDFWFSVIASLRRVLVGITIAFILGFPWGLLIGFYKTFRMMTYPPFSSYEWSVPSLGCPSPC